MSPDDARIQTNTESSAGFGKPRKIPRQTEQAFSFHRKAAAASRITAVHHALHLPRGSKNQRCRLVSLAPPPAGHASAVRRLPSASSPNCPRAAEMLPDNGGAGEGCCNPARHTGDAPEEPSQPPVVFFFFQWPRPLRDGCQLIAEPYLVWTGTNEAEDSAEAHPSHQDLSPRPAAIPNSEPAD